VPVDLSPVIAATTQWLIRAYPPSGGVLGAALAQAQVRQAATVAARLRYPTELDAELLHLTGPGGSARLDFFQSTQVENDDAAWRTWVDEVVASWAACLLSNPALAAAAVAALGDSQGVECDFRRLTNPDDLDRQAAVLLRHPDLAAPIADLHRPALLATLPALSPPA
jgi:hypothetical protein